MSSFDWKKNIEDFIKDGLIITAATIGIFFALKAANVQPPKASLDAMDIMKLTGGICGGMLVKDYGVYKKWIGELYNKNFITCYRVIKLLFNTVQKASNMGMFYFSMVKMPLGSVTLRWATASSRLNT